METKKIELTCIGCPMGCPLIVTMEDGAVVSVTGNTCPRGDAYTLAMVSCKTRSDIPKGKIFDVVRALKDVEVPAPITIGQVLAENVAGTGVDIIATKNIAHA